MSEERQALAAKWTDLVSGVLKEVGLKAEDVVSLSIVQKPASFPEISIQLSPKVMPASPADVEGA